MSITTVILLVMLAFGFGMIVASLDPDSHRDRPAIVGVLIVVATILVMLGHSL